MNEWLRQLAGTNGGVEISLWKSAVLFGHATLIGFYLMFLTGRVSRRTAASAARAEAETFIGSSSVLFVCVGMTSVMILVNDNLARAFAIGAAIALVRFRVKMAGKFIGISLLYGVLTGMACGLRRVDIAWSLAIVFGILLAIVLQLQKRLERTCSRERSARDERNSVDERAA